MGGKIHCGLIVFFLLLSAASAERLEIRNQTPGVAYAIFPDAAAVNPLVYGTVNIPSGGSIVVDLAADGATPVSLYDAANIANTASFVPVSDRRYRVTFDTVGFLGASGYPQGTYFLQVDEGQSLWVWFKRGCSVGAQWALTIIIFRMVGMIRSAESSQPIA